MTYYSETKDLTRGEAEFKIENLPAGKYKIKAKYLGAKTTNGITYKESEAEAELEILPITKTDTILTIQNNNINTTPTTTTTINGTLTDTENNPITNATIILTDTRNNTETITSTNNNGEYTYNIQNNTIGQTNYKIQYEGSTYYNKSTTNLIITTKHQVNINTTGDITIENQNANCTITATLTDEENNNINTGTATCLLEDINNPQNTYTITNDNIENSTITFELGIIPEGDYTATITYTGNNEYHDNTTTINVIIGVENTIITIITAPTEVETDETFNITGTLKNSDNNNPITNATITINDGTTDTTTTTDSNGEFTATLTGKSTTGEVDYTVRYAGDTHHKQSTQTITITTIQAVQEAIFQFNYLKIGDGRWQVGLYNPTTGIKIGIDEGEYLINTQTGYRVHTGTNGQQFNMDTGTPILKFTIHEDEMIIEGQNRSGTANSYTIPISQSLDGYYLFINHNAGGTLTMWNIELNELTTEVGNTTNWSGTASMSYDSYTDRYNVSMGTIQFYKDITEFL